MAPAVDGQAALAPFATAADLHSYIQATMPWQEPNGLTEEEGWAMTAYVIKLNRMNPGPELNEKNGRHISLHPQATVPTPTAPAMEAGAPPLQLSVLWLIGRAALIALVVLLTLQAVKNNRERAT